ncbi:hypothetical protein [Scopulibacillus cellulosilyticus]|uniref:Uncharacterized protein n=1 Tax=Scopulibacillus cellulosilyticus TaxID=2665665 RepID=A0ABW2Q700_9BACL
MNDDHIPLKVQKQEDFKGDQQFKEKVPWKLGKHLNNHHVENLNRLITDHYKHMSHILNNEITHTKKHD